MIPTLLILFPLIAAAFLFLLRETAAKRAALAFALVELGIFGYGAANFSGKPLDALNHLDVAWLDNLGAHFAVSMDGLSLLMVLLTTVLMPFIILSTENKNYSGNFYALVFVMQSALVGVFTAQDGLLFYIFWELALIPIYFICLIWGGENRGKVTFKFFVYTLAGSLLMLVGLLYLYFTTPGNHSFSLAALTEAGQNMSLSEQSWVFWAIFMAFAIKMPIFPFHTWQPDTYVTAPTAGTMLLSGIMLKMGVYGLMRWLLPIVPEGYQAWGNVAMVLSVIGIVYASCIAIVQKDFKRLIAYSSIAHVGLISAGIFSMTVEGWQGAAIQMVAHGINVVGLFYIADIIASRTRTNDIASLGGIRSEAPQFALLFLIILLGSVALPLTNGFVGEFLLLNGVFKYNVVIAVFAGLTVVLGAVYMLRSYQTMMLGEVNALTKGFTDLNGIEKTILISLAILVIVMGVYPKPLLDASASTVTQLLETYKMGLIK